MLVFALMLLFLLVTGMAWLLINRFLDRDLDERLEQITVMMPEGKAGRPQAELAIETLLQPFVKWSMPTTESQASGIRVTLSQAGWRSNASVVIFYGSKTLLAITFPIAYLLVQVFLDAELTLLGGLATSALLCGVGYYFPDVVLKQAMRLRKRELFESFPDALDLLRVCISAGLGLDSAINRVARQISLKSRALSEDFLLLTLELRAGLSKEQALRNLALRTGLEEVNGLVAMLIQSEKFGTSVSESLRIHAEALRTQRRMRAQELAAKVPVKLTVPMILCIFPALFVVILGPAVLNILRAFMNLPGGG